jgi:hypothetical protein
MFAVLPVLTAFSLGGSPVMAGPTVSGSVRVNNTSANPVPVTIQGGNTGSGNRLPTQNVNEPGRHPFQESIVLNSGAGCAPFVCSTSFSPVPAGKRLVVTYVSAVFVSSNGGLRIMHSSG